MIPQPDLQRSARLRNEPSAAVDATVQEPPCDHLRLDLGGALEDVEDAGVAQHPADRVLERIAVAAVDLQGIVGAAVLAWTPVFVLSRMCANS